MTGEYQHTLDSKGRLFIPSKLREELGDAFYVTFSKEKCLFAYSEAEWQLFLEKVNRLPYSVRNSFRFYFGSACKCEPDSQGRILLPQSLRDTAFIKKAVTVVGNNDHAEFWDTERYEKLRADAFADGSFDSVMDALDNV